MNRLFILSILALVLSQTAVAKESKRHQERPSVPMIREFK